MGQEVVLNKAQGNDPVTPNCAIDILLNPNLGAGLSSEAKRCAQTFCANARRLYQQRYPL